MYGELKVCDTVDKRLFVMGTYNIMSIQKRIIVVLGMHRSGTSAVTCGLTALGVDLGDTLMPPIEGFNAKGFFEDIDIYAFNVEILEFISSDWHCLAPIEPHDIETLNQKGYFLRAVDLLRRKTAGTQLFGFKDPRLAKLLPFWKPVFTHCGFDISYVLIIRNPLSVAQSLANRDGFSHEKSYMLWMGHVLTSLEHTETYLRVLVDYDRLMEEPQKNIEFIAKYLGLAVDAQALQRYQSEFIDDKLRHTIYDKNDLVLDRACPPLVHELYVALLDVVADNRQQIDLPAFHDRTKIWINEFERLKSGLRLADQLTEQIDRLRQSIAVRDSEITGIITSAIAQDENIFRHEFDPVWYVKKYADIDPSLVDPYQHYISYGILEGRIPSNNLIGFTRDGLLNALKNIQAQRDQTMTLAKDQLQQITEQKKENLERTDMFNQELQRLQAEYAERELTHTTTLDSLQNELASQLRNQVQREQGMAAQIMSLQHQANADKEALSQQYEARIQTLNDQKAENEWLTAERIHTLNQELQRLQAEYAERELTHTTTLDSLQQQSAAEKVHLEVEYQTCLQTLQHQQAEREQSFNTQLLAKHDELMQLSQRGLDAQQTYAQSVSQFEQQLQTMRTSYTWRWTAPLRFFAQLFIKNDASLQEDLHDKRVLHTPGSMQDGIAINTTQSNPQVNIHEQFTMHNSAPTSGSNVSSNRTPRIAQSLTELLSYYDEEFVHCAYQTLLGRAPDAEGLCYYLARVRSGVSKVEILTQLRIGEEGKSHTVIVTGLDEAIKRHKLLKTPLLGELLKIAGVRHPEANILQSLRMLDNKIYALNINMLNNLFQINNNLKQLMNKPTQNPNKPELPEQEPIEFGIQIQFDADWYLEQNPDVAASGVNPLEHYLLYGKSEWRHPIFDNEWYLSQYPDVKKSGMDPREHYIKHGKAEGRHPSFDKDWYLNQYPDIAHNGMDAHEHYLQYGKTEGRFPAYSPFNTDRTNYPKWIQEFDTLTDKIRVAMRGKSDQFEYKPLVSVVMPVYNPNLAWLKEAIESVRKQIYPNWELCIADDASTNLDIRPMLERYAHEDKRIKITFRTTNGHISAASNSALSLAHGEWIALLDHDDLLAEQALFWVVDAINKHPEIRLIYSDEDKIDENGVRSGPYFKCDWNPDLFYSHNLITHLGVYHAELVSKIDGFRIGFEGSQDYDLALRCIEQIAPGQIYHIPRVLYHWRMHVESTAQSSGAKPYAMIAGERAINEHFERQGISAKAELINYGYRVRYALPGILPLVSLIVPTRNGLNLLKQCIESILTKTTYSNYEILIVDNGSDDPATLVYLQVLAMEPRILVIHDDRPFNYSALNNAAVKLARGEIVGLINNDIEVISPDWLSEMVSHALRPEVGAVGARLWYTNDTLQHGGVIIGIGGLAGHSHKHLHRNQPGYFGRANLIQSFSAVTAACLLIRKSIFNSLEGLNEMDLQVAFNDVDFCLRVRESGYRNIWTPYAELYHHESATRGYEDTPEKEARFQKEATYLKKYWNSVLHYDPAYSPNLTFNHEDFSFAWPPRVELLSDI